MGKPTGDLQAGVAKVNITPPVGCYLQGYTRGKPSVGVRDDLYAKALVLDDGKTQLAIATVDLVGLEYSSIGAIRNHTEELAGIPGENVMVAASHTHAGPVVMALGGDPWDEDYVREIEKKIVGAVYVAANTRRPVEVGVWTGEVSFNINRRVRTLRGTQMLPNPKGPVDRRVRVVRIDDGSPVPYAVLVHYTCHATVFDGGNLRISGDYPGATQRFVEHAYGPDTTCLFAQGCCGNVRPNVVTPEGLFRGGDDLELERIGRTLGSEAVNACEQIQTKTVEEIGVHSKIVDLPYGKPLPDREFQELLAQKTYAPWREITLERKKKGKTEMEVQVMQVGDLRIVGLPGEVFVEIGEQIETRIGGEVLVVGYANGNLGYLCTARSYKEKGYEPWTSFQGYHHPTRFRPETEDLILDTVGAVWGIICPS